MIHLTYFLLLSLLVSAWGQGRHPSPSLAPWTTESGTRFRFRAFEDDQQGFYLIWPRQGNAGIELLAQHIDKGGRALWKEPGVPLVKGLSAQGTWEAIADSKGGVLITWEDAGRVYVRRFKETAEEAWTTKSYAVSPSTFTQKSPVLAADGAGGVYVVWQEKRFAAPSLPAFKEVGLAPNRDRSRGRWVLMAQHFNELGAPLWPAEGTRVSLRPSDQQKPSLVYDGMAGIIAAWYDAREQASQLQAQRMDYQGTRIWGLEGILITAPAGDPKKEPYLGAVGNGAGLLAWQASSGADRLFLQLITSGGKAAWQPNGLEVGVGNWHVWNPVLHGDGNGGAWLGWEDYRNDQNWQVFIHHLHSSGPSGWPSGETALTTVRADQGRLAFTDDGLSGIVAVWVDNRSGTTGLYMQRVNAQGRILMGEEGFKVADRLNAPLNPQIVYLAPGQVAIAWADAASKGQWSLYWQRFGPF